MSDGNAVNDTIIMPVIETLPMSRNSDGRLTGDIRIVDFVAVHLDGVERITVADPRFDASSSKTMTVEAIVGTVEAIAVAADGTDDPAGFAEGVFALQLLR
jgi:hypothetical protein